MTQTIEKTAQAQSRNIRSQGFGSMKGRAVKAGWFIAALVFSVQAQAGTYYFHNDHLGTPQVLTDDAQTVVWKGEYDPFGMVTETINQVEQNLRFPGQYFDQETGLHYNYFRTYDPGTGRYVESDPIGLTGGINTYGYVQSNPIIYSDLLGLAPNQQGATGSETIWRELIGYSQFGLSPNDALSRLSQAHGNNKDRYFYTEKYGWVDVRHFGAAADYAYRMGSFITETLGFINESVQWCSESGNDYRSGFSPEDISSNAAGAAFGDDYLGQGSSIAHDFTDFLRDVGGLPSGYPLRGMNQLPMTDPAVRGGVNRGSSNISTSNGPGATRSTF